MSVFHGYKSLTYCRLKSLAYEAVLGLFRAALWAYFVKIFSLSFHPVWWKKNVRQVWDDFPESMHVSCLSEHSDMGICVIDYVTNIRQNLQVIDVIVCVIIRSLEITRNKIMTARENTSTDTCKITATITQEE